MRRGVLVGLGPSWIEEGGDCVEVEDQEDSGHFGVGRGMWW